MATAITSAISGGVATAPNSEATTGLPSSWEVRLSRSHNMPYYFNPTTKESMWEPPAGTDAEQLKNYMAANYSRAAAPQQQQQQASKIRASHLLVKHSGSRRPSSWKEKEITRSESEARTILEDYERRIRSGETTLAQLAVTESDCSSARKGGDLGFFGKGEMQKEFEDATVALQVGEMSGVVKTASGLHLIERTA
ncbi:uncharacterized protein V1518DRAFT_413774 [Limtongia smithiae]|uniref:uncharacterized protein n=1 Tax=Limtongia smithiae TaxID=1125753 RepID=UPI0034CE9CE3